MPVKRRVKECHVGRGYLHIESERGVGNALGRSMNTKLIYISYKILSLYAVSNDPQGPPLREQVASQYLPSGIELTQKTGVLLPTL